MSQRSRPSGCCVSLLICAASSLLALTSCAPMTAMPPPVPLGEKARAAGAAASGGVYAYIDRPSLTEPAGAVQGWLMSEREGNVQRGMLVFGGSPSFMGAGGFVRVDLDQREDLYWGPQLAGGLSWISLGMPLSWRPRDSTWLYTNPAVTLSLIHQLQVPVGASIELGERGMLNVEAGANLQLLRDQELFGLGFFDMWGQTAYVAVGGGLRF